MFIRREVQLTKMMDQKRCSSSPHWIMHAIQARTLASPLWKTLFQAFTQTRRGLEQCITTHHKEILRQQLFANPMFLDTEGNMFGVEKDSTYTTWAMHDTNTIQDIWDVETQDRMTASQFKQRTKSQLIPQQRPSLLRGLTFRPLPYQIPQICEWMIADTTGPST